MKGKKAVRTRGKIKLSKYFQEFENGNKVGVTIERAIDFNFPERLQGSTGVVEGKRGSHYLINIKTQEKNKKFLIAPVHLKKLK